MVELQPSKLATWVRFPSPAPSFQDSTAFSLPKIACSIRRAPRRSLTLGYEFGNNLAAYLAELFEAPGVEVSELVIVETQQSENGAMHVFKRMRAHQPPFRRARRLRRPLFRLWHRRLRTTWTMPFALWSRPNALLPPRTPLSGERPNSPPQMTSVLSSRPRCFRSFNRPAMGLSTERMRAVWARSI